MKIRFIELDEPFAEEINYLSDLKGRSAECVQNLLAKRHAAGMQIYQQHSIQAFLLSDRSDFIRDKPAG